MIRRPVPLLAHAGGGLVQGAALYGLYVALVYSPNAIGVLAMGGAAVAALVLLAAWPIVVRLRASRAGARGRPRLGAVVVWAVALVVGVAACGAGWDVAGRRALARATGALEQAGFRFEPPRPAASIPDADNAAEWLKQASAAFRGGPRGVPGLAGEAAPPPKDVERAREIATGQARAIELVLRAGQAPGVDWKVDWSRPWLGIDLPRDTSGEPVQLVELVRLVGWRAVLLAGEGEVTAAEAHVAAALAAARAVAALPLTTAQLLADRMTREALAAARPVLARSLATGEGFRAQLPEGSLAAGLRHADTLDLTYVPRLFDGASLMSFASMPATGGRGPWALRDVRGAIGGFLYYPVHRLDLAEHQRIALALLEAMSAPPGQLEPRLRAASRALQERHWILTEMGYGVVNIYLSSFLGALEAEADAALARAAIAARAESKRAGRWPDAVPGIDPFTGGPLHARADGDALVLWSVGRDLRDDGGVATSAPGRSLDVVWRVRPGS